MRTRILLVALVALVGATAASCAADDIPGLEGPDDISPALDVDDDGKADSLSQTATYYRVAPDLRKCASPVCGGWLVSRVNRSWTLCHDNVWRSSCYVVDFDLESDLGLSESEANLVVGGMRNGRVLVRGRLQTRSYNAKRLGHFKTSEAWQAASATVATGTFYKVTDKQLVCIAQPCPSLHEAMLNSTVSRDIHSLDLSAPSEDETLINRAWMAMEQGPIIVAGSHSTFTAPLSGNQGVSLDGSQFFSRVRPLVAYSPQAHELAGRQFSDATSGNAIYPRSYELDHASWNVRVSDAVSPCAAGAACIWSGIITREATWSVAGDRVSLTYAGDGANGYGIEYFPALEVKKDALGNLVLVEVRNSGQPNERRFRLPEPN